jgi:type I restriction enzyme, S subunit
MKKKSETLMPKLRFPEFKDVPEWKEKPLEAIVSPVAREKEKPVEPYTGLGVRSHGKGTFLKPFEAPEKSSMEHLYEVQTDDLIVNITFAWEGAIAIARSTDTGALVSHRFPTYRFKEDEAIPEFFRYSICDKQLIYQLGVISPGGAGRNRVLNKREFLKLTRPLPCLPEQRKITACLASLDERIAAEGRKLEALRAHKIGLMQQLFPREGKTRPRLRFPEFRDKPAWMAHPLDEFVVRSFYGTSKSTSMKGRYPVLRMGNMVDGGLNISKLVYIDLDDEEFESIRLMDGDILLNRTNSIDLVGKISIFRLPGNYVSASYVVSYRLDRDRLAPPFCNLMLNTPQYQKRIKALARPSVSQWNINPTSFRKELMITVPPPVEQQRITGCLSSLDALIAAQSRKLDGLRSHKTGLMQQLFPSPEVA